MNNKDTQILKKILKEIEYLENLLKNISLDKFLDDETMQRAAAMSAINIGELSKHLSNNFFTNHPNSELKYAAKTRDVYAHGYYSLSFETVYKTAKDDYPHLKEEIKSYIPETVPRVGSDNIPDSVIKMMDESINNLKKNNVSNPIDLKDFKN